MAWKRYSDEDILRPLRETELGLASGSPISLPAKFKRKRRAARSDRVWCQPFARQQKLLQYNHT